MSFIEITSILEHTIGLDPDSIGHAAISKGIERRMLLSQSPDMTIYLALLQQSLVEMSLLIEELVVPETWFFREEGAFDALRQLTTNEWATKILHRPLEIACIPCSTGEEPYSVAMCLDEIGLSKHQYNIDAIDISEVALARANEGIYSEVSFRNNDLSFRDTYFNKIDRTYNLKPSILNAVNFYHGNALALPQRMMNKKYDVIFCRNLMIYLGNDKRVQLINQLRSLLIETGVIFVGYSEARLMTDAGFESLDYSKAFAFCHRNDTSHKNVRKRITQKLKTKVLRKPVKRFLSENPNKTEPVSSRSPYKNENNKDITLRDNKAITEQYQALIAQAEHFANQGDYVESQRLCEEYLQHHDSDTVPVIFLMAVINLAQGNPESAENYFRKVVYLDPMHREGLLQLSLLAEKKGDTERANNIKKRLSKIIEKGETANG